MPQKQAVTKPAPPPAFQEPENFYTPPRPVAGTESLDVGAVRRALSLDEIEVLASTNPDQALKLLNLQAQLEAARALHEKRTQDANFRLSMLQSTEAKLRREAQYRAACEARGHQREDGSCAIGGQRDSANVFHGVCCKCGKTWEAGIGAGLGQLPPFFANRLNAEMIGG